MNSSPTLSIGSTGHDVRRLQRIFVMTKSLAPSGITGSFDATTEQAVKDFRTYDGVIGAGNASGFRNVSAVSNALDCGS
jgi:peptidoglycan hydrolase-like protein with peptidoglycan-binding domain